MTTELNVKMLFGWRMWHDLPWREDATGRWQPARHTSYDGDGNVEREYIYDTGIRLRYDRAGILNVVKIHDGREIPE